MFRRFIFGCQQVAIVRNSFRYTNSKNNITALRTQPLAPNTVNYATGSILKLIGRRQSQPICNYKTQYQNPLVSIQKQQQRYFRLSSPQNALPAPVIFVILGKVAKLFAIFLGRYARRWWYKLPPERQRELLTGIDQRNKYILWGLSGGMSFVAFLYHSLNTDETPMTKRRRFVAFKDEQFLELEKIMLDAMVKKHMFEVAPPGNSEYQRVLKVVQGLINANEDIRQIREKEWTVTVIKDDNVCNAAVLSIGSIFVFSGLLKFCDTDNQLGMVLAHEMSHAVLGHGNELLSFLHFMDLLAVIPIAILWAVVPSKLMAAFIHLISSIIKDLLFSLPYRRKLEMEADKVGLALAAKSCFDVRAAPLVWAKLALMGGLPLEIEWLSTHPNSQTRQAQMEELMSAAIQLRENSGCPRLPNYDPRDQIALLNKKIMGVMKGKTVNRADILVPATTRPAP